jgi:hypothetical protein
MVNDVERIRTRLADLIAQGESIVATRTQEQKTYGLVDSYEFTQWHLSCMSFLKQVFEADSLQLAHFSGDVATWRDHHVKLGVAVLKSALEELQVGPLGKMEDLVSGEIFTDFLEMASYLHEQGYKDPAASLAGAVLEDGLKRLAKKNDIRVSNRDDISSVNSKLAAKPVYNRIVQREVEIWTAVRNHADHHQFDQYSEQQVKAMLDGVQAFLARLL